MQMTLSIAVPSPSNAKDVCAFCGGDHEEPKAEKIDPVAPSDKGWHPHTALVVRVLVTAEGAR